MKTLEIIGIACVALYILFRGWLVMVESLCGRRLRVSAARFEPFIDAKKLCKKSLTFAIQLVIGLVIALTIIFAVMAYNRISL